MNGAGQGTGTRRGSKVTRAKKDLRHLRPAPYLSIFLYPNAPEKVLFALFTLALCFEILFIHKRIKSTLSSALKLSFLSIYLNMYFVLKNLPFLAHLSSRFCSQKHHFALEKNIETKNLGILTFKFWKKKIDLKKKHKKTKKEQKNKKKRKRNKNLQF